MAILLHTRRLLETFGTNAVKQMAKNAAQYSATGKMAKSFRHQVHGEGLTIYGIDYLQWAETGRGKTRRAGVPGEPTLRETLIGWLKIKSIPLWRDKKGRFIPRATQAFLIARKIHQSGTLLFRTKGFRDIYTSVINDKSVNKLIESVQVDYVTRTTSDIISTLNQMFEKQKAA